MLKKDFSLIGLGICSWIAIVSLAYTLQIISIDLFIINNIDYDYANVIQHFLYNFIIVVLYYIFLKSLKHIRYLNYKKVIKYLIVSFILIQVLQFLYAFYVGDYIYENYNENWKSFYDSKNNLFLSIYVPIIGELLRYICIAIVFYQFYKNQD